MNITKETKKIILANNLQHLMSIHNISKKNLQEALDIPRETLRGWVTGEDYPSIEKIARLARFFNVNISSLIEYNNQFEGLTEQDIKIICEMQVELAKEGIQPMFIQLFSMSACYVIKYLKNHKLYGGVTNE